jgi:hypothetical protein
MSLTDAERESLSLPDRCVCACKDDNCPRRTALHVAVEAIATARVEAAVEAFRAAAIAELNAVTPADWVLAGHHAGQVAARTVADLPTNSAQRP